MKKVLFLLTLLVTLVVLASCGVTSTIPEASPLPSNGAESFIPDGADIIEVEGDPIDEPAYASLEEAFETGSEISTQGLEAPKVKVYTHTFSTGEVYTYSVLNGVVFQGDIILSTVPELLKSFDDYEASLVAADANGAIETQGLAAFWNQPASSTRVWPKQQVRIDLKSLQENFNDSQESYIRNAFRYLEASTNVDVIYTNTGVRVTMLNPASGCNATLGYRSQGNYMNLSDRCFGRQPTHELMHILGIYHEHQRSDRGNYIKVLDGNLTSLGKSAFQMVSSSNRTPRYDFSSIMHYKPSVSENPEFVIGGKPAFTILSNPFNLPVGGDTITYDDINTINKITAGPGDCAVKGTC